MDEKIESREKTYALRSSVINNIIYNYNVYTLHGKSVPAEHRLIIELI